MNWNTPTVWCTLCDGIWVMMIVTQMRYARLQLLVEISVTLASSWWRMKPAESVKLRSNVVKCLQALV